jgi:integrase
MRKIQLAEATKEYEAHLRSKGLAINTVKANTQPLRSGLKTWGDIQIATIRPVHIDRLFAEGNWAPSTRNLHRGALLQFFAWCRHNQYMARDFDPLFGWRNMKVPRVRKMRLDVDEFYPLMDSAEHPRDRAAIAVGLFTMARGSEIQNIRVGDLNMKDLTMEIYRVKTKTWDTMPVCEELREEMVRWMNWYRADQGNLVGSWFLIPSKAPDLWKNEGGRLVPTGVLSHVRPEQKMTHPYRVAQRGLKALGYDVKGEGEHTLRRSSARAMADRLREEGTDGALMRVASILGHQDLKVTQHYIGWDVEAEKRDEMLKGKTMFPSIRRDAGTLRVVREG